MKCALAIALLMLAASVAAQQAVHTPGHADPRGWDAAGAAPTTPRDQQPQNVIYS